MDSSVDLATTPRVQSLEWSKVATILHRIVAKFHPSDPLTRHAQKLEEFLWVNWSVLTNPSKLRIYRMFTQCLKRAYPSQVTAQEFIKQIPTPLFMIALLEKGECDAWKIQIPRETVLEVLSSIVKLAPTNQRFIEWFATLSNSRLLSRWDALPPVDQLKVLKTAIQTRNDIVQAQERKLNRKSRGVTSLPSLPTSTELLAGVSSNRNGRDSTKKQTRHIASVYTASGRRHKSVWNLAASPGLPGQVDFQVQSPPPATAWTPGCRHEQSPHISDHQGASTYPIQQRRFEDLGPMQLPTFENPGQFDRSLMPPPPLPGLQSSLHQLPPSYRSPPYQPPVTPFDQSYLNKSPKPREWPQPSSRAELPLNTYDDTDYHQHMINEHMLSQQHSEALDPRFLDQHLSHSSRNNSIGYDNNSRHLQQQPSSSLHSSFGDYDDQRFKGDGESQGIQHGHLGHPQSPSGYNDSSDTLNLPPH